jgi:hypothetical protein
MFSHLAERNERILRTHGWVPPDEPDYSDLEVAELEGLPEELAPCGQAWV